MRLLDHDLPERHGFNFVLGFIVASVLIYMGLVNYAQYRTITQIKKDLCDEECVKKLVAQKAPEQRNQVFDVFERPIAAVDTADVQVAAPTQATKKVVPVVTQGQKFESFKSLSGGSAASVQWLAINSEKFSLDMSLYPEGAVATIEGWVELENGASKAYVRLYDMTNNRVVDGSEVSVSTNGKASFYSNSLSIWRGTNQYRVEAKTDTGYLVTVSDLRIKIKKM